MHTAIATVDMRDLRAAVFVANDELSCIHAVIRGEPSWIVQGERKSGSPISCGDEWAELAGLELMRFRSEVEYRCFHSDDWTGARGDL